jgi:hypothetical protein
MSRKTNTSNVLFAAANTSADDALCEALDALSLAREALEWIGTLADTIVAQAPKNSPIRNLAMIASHVADNAIADANDTHERLSVAPTEATKAAA